MKVEIFPNGIYGAITYLVYDEISKEGALIDCTCSIDEIADIVKKDGKSIFYSTDTSEYEKENLEENLIATYLYLDGDMKSVTYDDLMRYITLDLDPEKLKRDFQRSNNFSVQISLKMSEKLLAIIDKIPLYKNEAKQPKKEEKKPTPKTTSNPKQPKTDTPAPPPMFEIRRSKIDILIASLTIFIYITNAQEENLYDIINTKETDLFEKICFMSVSDFNMLYENQVFREEILSKSIFRFKNQEAVSRDWNDIIREDILVA